MRLPARIATTVAVVLTLVALAAPAGAGRPDLVFDLGRTVAVKDGPGGAGMSLGLSALWRLEDRFRVGVMTFADGLGERTERLIGAGGVDLGPVAGIHRAAQGAALRLEAHGRGPRALQPHLAVTWGFYRVEDDVRGTLVQSDDAVGFGVGLGLLREFNEHHAVGLALRAQQLSRSAAGRYLTAALEWRWSTSAAD